MLSETARQRKGPAPHDPLDAKEKYRNLRSPADRTRPHVFSHRTQPTAIVSSSSTAFLGSDGIFW
eukprot:43931-Eustigmatos_ZCMA.PRE.1